MTTPTHTSSIPAGGILTQHVDSDWADYAAGRPLQQRVCISVVQPSKIASGNKQTGRSKNVGYEDVHLVEITDPHEADRLRHLLTATRAERGLMASQPAMLALSEAEQIESLKDMIKDWASEQDLPIALVDARFVEYFGGAENASAETVQACRSVTQLREFAYEVGAIADELPPGEEPEDGEPEDDEAPDEFGRTPEDDSDTTSEVVRSVPFQEVTE